MGIKGLCIEQLGGCSPLQAFGSIHAFSFYFRARNDRWQFAVATCEDATNDDAVAAMSGERPGFVLSKPYGRSGGYDASFMEEIEAIHIIEECTKVFLATLFRVQARTAATSKVGL